MPRPTNDTMTTMIRISCAEVGIPIQRQPRERVTGVEQQRVSTVDTGPAHRADGSIHPLPTLLEFKLVLLRSFCGSRSWESCPAVSGRDPTAPPSSPRERSPMSASQPPEQCIVSSHAPRMETESPNDAILGAVSQPRL